MEYVSLLPPEIKKKRLDDRRQDMLIRIVIALFLIAMIVYSYLYVSAYVTRIDLLSLRSEREFLENSAAELEQYANLYARMNSAEEVVIATMGNIPLWSELLHNLGMSMPTGSVWLSDITLSYGGGSGSLNIRGWSYSHSHVADMIEQVETMEQLDNILCRVSAETTYGGRDAVQFVLDAVILPGPQFAPFDEEE